jgi:putative ABC transport system permease protein
VSARVVHDTVGSPAQRSKITAQLPTRWVKVLRDVHATRGRLLLSVLALGASVAGVTTMLMAHTVLRREVPRNYLSSNPAAAQMEFTGAIDSALLQRIRAQPNIAGAELATTISGRMQVAANEWLPLLLFVVPDMATQRISRQLYDSGAVHPPGGALVIERSALPLTHAAIGGTRTVELPISGRQKMVLSTSVQDPGVAPAWQEQTVYAYADARSLQLLGEPVEMTLLRIAVLDGAMDATAIRATAQRLAGWLETQGVSVVEVRIPPPGRHPHQSQMNAVISMLLIFSMLALGLGAILTATVINALLAQQLRQIAIMKAIGARTMEIVRMYLGMVVLIGASAVSVGVPLGLLCGRILVGLTAALLNLSIASVALPWWVFAIAALLGIGAPLIAACVPVLLAARRTVRAALSDYGVRHMQIAVRGPWSALRFVRSPSAVNTLAVRSVFRRRTRLAMTVSLLAGAGAMFLTSANLQSAWERTVEQAVGSRMFSAELRLQSVEPWEKIRGALNSVRGITTAESWSSTGAAVAVEKGPELTAQYPDGGHGGFALREAPPATALIAHRMLAGRWILPTDTGTAVLNTLAQRIAFRTTQVGDTIRLSVEGRQISLRVTGFTEELLTPGAVYVSPETFGRATAAPNATNAVRVVFSDRAQIDSMSTVVSEALERGGVRVSSIITERRFASAQGGHIYILVYALRFIAAIMALVGFLGLASSLGTSVVERTREFGVLRTVGARSAAVIRLVVTEGVITAMLSWFVALALSLPLSAQVGAVLGAISAQELLLRLSPIASIVWMLTLVFGAAVVSYLPARRAANLTVRETLAYT